MGRERRLVKTTRLAVGVLLLVELAGVFRYAWLAISANRFAYALDYGEGFLLDQTNRLVRGETIYPPNIQLPPYLIASYPPLYAGLQVPFAMLFGPAFWYGRLISQVSLLAIAALIGVVVSRWTGSRTASFSAALAVFTVPVFVDWAQLNRVDTLALALAWAALAVVTAPGPAGRGRLVGTALLLVASMYTKQSYALVWPVAACVWLLAHRERRAALFLFLCAYGSALVLFVVADGLSHHGFRFHLIVAQLVELSRRRLFSSAFFFASTTPAALACAIVVGAAVALGWFPVAAGATYATILTGGLLTSLLVAKVGSGQNYFLELASATCVAIGLAVAQSRRRPRLVLLAVALLILQDASLALRHPAGTLWDQLGFDAANRDIQALIERSPGPVLADDAIGMLALAGRQVYMDPFEVTQMARSGFWDEAPVLALIAERAFPLIVIAEPVRGNSNRSLRWTPAMLDRIHANYEVRERQLFSPSVAYVVYVPRAR